jgi:hypothetical protein
MKYRLLGNSGRIAMQVPAFKPSACSRVAGYSEVKVSCRRIQLCTNG